MENTAHVNDGVSGYVIYVIYWFILSFIIPVFLYVYDLLNGKKRHVAFDRYRVVQRCCAMGILGGAIIFLIIFFIAYILYGIGLVGFDDFWSFMEINKGDKTMINIVFFVATSAYSVHYALDNKDEILKET